MDLESSQKNLKNKDRGKYITYYIIIVHQFTAAYLWERVTLKKSWKIKSSDFLWMKIIHVIQN